jgi:hypothetical protein
MNSNLTVAPGLPDVFKQKIPLLVIFAIEDVGIFYGRLVDFPAIRYKVIAIWYSFWSFGIFPPFW